MKRYDISAPIYDGMPGFPGDPSVQIVPTKSIERGDAYSLSALSMSSHTATHIDPPCHFIPGGTTIDRIDLEAVNGPCEVVEVADPVDVVGPDAVRAALPESVRILFKTRNSARLRTEAFFEDYVALSPEAARVALDRGVRLVGIDSVSIERDPSGKFPVHHMLLGAGCLVLEGLRLDGVPGGTYELQCLPLRIRDGDGGPARAILTAPG